MFNNVIIFTQFFPLNVSYLPKSTTSILFPLALKWYSQNENCIALHPCLKRSRIINTYTVIHSFSACYWMCFIVCAVFLYTGHPALQGSLLVLGYFPLRPLCLHSAWDLLLKLIFTPRSGYSCSVNTSLLDYWAPYLPPIQSITSPLVCPPCLMHTL